LSPGEARQPMGSACSWHRWKKSLLFETWEQWFLVCFSSAQLWRIITVPQAGRRRDFQSHPFLGGQRSGKNRAFQPGKINQHPTSHYSLQASVSSQSSLRIRGGDRSQSQAHGGCAQGGVGLSNDTPITSRVLLRLLPDHAPHIGN
jgi:hypothetical protein